MLQGSAGLSAIIELELGAATWMIESTRRCLDAICGAPPPHMHTSPECLSGDVADVRIQSRRLALAEQVWCRVAPGGASEW